MVERSHETVTVDGHCLHYVAAGDRDAPPVVLLHGGLVDAAHVSWGGLIDPLAAEYRVLALDLLGYGASDKPDVTYSLDRHIQTVEGFLDAVGPDSAALVGTSLGGGAALGVALHAPELVDRLVLLDAYGLGRELPNGTVTYLTSRTGLLNKAAVALMRRSRGFTRASLSNVVYDVDALSPDAVDAVWEEVKRPGVGTAYRSFRAAEVTTDGYRTDFTDRLDAVDAPALVLHGEHDRVFPPSWSERAADRLPDARLRILADCGHWAPRERPSTVLDHVCEFVPSE